MPASLICSGIAMLFSGASDLLPNIACEWILTTRNEKKSRSRLWIVIRLIKRVFLLISLPVELVISSIYVSRHAARHPSLDIVFIRSSLMTYSGQSFSLPPNLCFPQPLQMPFRVLPLHQTLDSASSESHCG